MVLAKNAEQLETLREFLWARSGAVLSPVAHVIGWVSKGQLVIVVGIDAFVGKTAQIHVAFAQGWHYPPRVMLRAVFDHVFNACNREMLLGVLNSHNEPAMRFDMHLGFLELGRIEGVHDGGGDMVLLGMRRDQCKYLKETERADVYA